MSAKPESSSSAALTKLLPIGVIVVVIAVVLYFFLAGGTKAPAPSAAKPAKTAAPVAAAPAAATTTMSNALPELTAQQLLKEASDAMRDKRFVTPPGNNAFEYYERLLEKEPDNQTAKDALRETFPIVIGVPEQEINAGNIDEATRLINLLAKADPTNYTLTILRSKLDAKKKQLEREQAQQAAAAAAAAAAKAQAAAAAAAAAQAQSANAKPGTGEEATAANQPEASSSTGAGTAAKPSRPAQKSVAVATPPPPPTPVGETHPAEIIKSAPPDYPPDAVRRRQQGWVEVEFTVMPDGSVANATVVNANPARVFNAAALSAVGRWTFKPRMENGKAVEEKVRRRIEFKF